MKSSEIFLLDLNPSAGMGSALRAILEPHVTAPIMSREENPESSGFDSLLPEISTSILNLNPRVIFLALPSYHLEQTKKLVHYFNFNQDDLPLVAKLADLATP